MNVARAIDRIYRAEAGQVLATLIRQLGDFTLAEDALGDALMAALERWPVDGLPSSPGAWLTTTARRKALDRLRRRGNARRLAQDVELELRLQRWDEGRPDRDAQVQIAQDMVSYWQYCEAHVAAQLLDPGDHFTGDLLRIHLADPSTLSVAEITSVIYGLSFAGHETTTNLLSNTIRRLLEDRSRWEAILADRGAIDAAVVEGVRHDSSVVAWRRITTCEVALGDVTIPAGSRLLLLLGAANHDPARFTEPERFDPARPNAADALSFGWGKHYCLGATLAKLEVAVVLEELAARRPSLRLVPQTFSFNPNVSFRGPKQLRVELG